MTGRARNVWAYVPCGGTRAFRRPAQEQCRMDGLPGLAHMRMSVVGQACTHSAPRQPGIRFHDRSWAWPWDMRRHVHAMPLCGACLGWQCCSALHAGGNHQPATNGSRGGPRACGVPMEATIHSCCPRMRFGTWSMQRPSHCAHLVLGHPHHIIDGHNHCFLHAVRHHLRTGYGGRGQQVVQAAAVPRPSLSQVVPTLHGPHGAQCHDLPFPQRLSRPSSCPAFAC